MSGGKRPPKDKKPEPRTAWPDQEEELEIAPGLEDDVESQVDEKLTNAWQPHIVENRPEQKAMHLLEPKIRRTWQVAAIAATTSFLMVAWVIGQRRTTGFQGLLTMDGVLLIALGFGTFSYQLSLAYLLVGWTMLCTVLVYSFQQPLDINQKLLWLVMRGIFIVVFLRGARAVSKRNTLRRGQKRSNPLRWREAIYNLKGPAAVVLAACLILNWSYNMWMDALSGSGGPNFGAVTEGGKGGGGGTITRRFNNAVKESGIAGAWNEIFVYEPAEDEERNAEEVEEFKEEVDEAWEAHREQALEAQRDGEAVGAESDADSCQEAALRRQRNCQDAACRKVSLVFLGNCLGQSTTVPDYCLSVPKLNDHATGMAWRDASCRLWIANAKQGEILTPGGSLVDMEYLTTAKAKTDCAAFYTRLQYHCHGSERE
jgi:hypothetical protein